MEWKTQARNTKLKKQQLFDEMYRNKEAGRSAGLGGRTLSHILMKEFARRDMCNRSVKTVISIQGRRTVPKLNLYFDSMHASVRSA